MELPEKKILVLSRMYFKNYGDPIIGDCCKYIIEKTAKENDIKVKVSLYNVYEKNKNTLKEQLKKQDVVVFPGGGLNAITFNEMLLNVFELMEPDTPIFFNAVGILRVKPKKRNEKLLIELFNKPQVKQVTTRGDYQKLLKYIQTPKDYPPKLVFDPAIWVNEAYGIEKKPKGEKIGIGVIRPELFQEHIDNLSIEDVFQMYADIITELESKGYSWELFTNGWKYDYRFGKKLLRRLGLSRKKYLSKKVKNSRELVEKISSYKAVIAARLHANIISTSLGVPSVGLVWNDKMNLFAQMIGAEERYVCGENLKDAKYIVRQLEQAIDKGYDEEKINDMKSITVETIKNIIN